MRGVKSVQEKPAPDVDQCSSDTTVYQVFSANSNQRVSKTPTVRIRRQLSVEECYEPKIALHLSSETTQEPTDVREYCDLRSTTGFVSTQRVDSRECVQKKFDCSEQGSSAISVFRGHYSECATTDYNQQQERQLLTSDEDCYIDCTEDSHSVKPVGSVTKPSYTRAVEGNQSFRAGVNESSPLHWSLLIRSRIDESTTHLLDVPGSDPHLEDLPRDALERKFVSSASDVFVSADKRTSCTSVFDASVSKPRDCSDSVTTNECGGSFRADGLCLVKRFHLRTFYHPWTEINLEGTGLDSNRQSVSRLQGVPEASANEPGRKQSDSKLSGLLRFLQQGKIYEQLAKSVDEPTAHLLARQTRETKEKLTNTEEVGTDLSQNTSSKETATKARRKRLSKKKSGAKAKEISHKDGTEKVLVNTAEECSHDSTEAVSEKQKVPTKYSDYSIERRKTANESNTETLPSPPLSTHSSTDGPTPTGSTQTAKGFSYPSKEPSGKPPLRPSFAACGKAVQLALSLSKYTKKSVQSFQNESIAKAWTSRGDSVKDSLIMTSRKSTSKDKAHADASSLHTSHIPKVSDLPRFQVSPVRRTNSDPNRSPSSTKTISETTLQEQVTDATHCASDSPMFYVGATPDQSRSPSKSPVPQRPESPVSSSKEKLHELTLKLQKHETNIPQASRPNTLSIPSGSTYKSSSGSNVDSIATLPRTAAGRETFHKPKLNVSKLNSVCVNESEPATTCQSSLKSIGGNMSEKMLTKSKPTSFKNDHDDTKVDVVRIYSTAIPVRDSGNTKLTRADITKQYNSSALAKSDDASSPKTQNSFASSKISDARKKSLPENVSRLATKNDSRSYATAKSFLTEDKHANKNMLISKFGERLPKTMASLASPESVDEEEENSTEVEQKTYQTVFSMKVAPQKDESSASIEKKKRRKGIVLTSDASNEHTSQLSDDDSVDNSSHSLPSTTSMTEMVTSVSTTPSVSESEASKNTQENVSKITVCDDSKLLKVKYYSDPSGASSTAKDADTARIADAMSPSSSEPTLGDRKRAQSTGDAFESIRMEKVDKMPPPSPFIRLPSVKRRSKSTDISGAIQQVHSDSEPFLRVPLPVTRVHSTPTTPAFSSPAFSPIHHSLPDRTPTLRVVGSSPSFEDGSGGHGDMNMATSTPNISLIEGQNSSHPAVTLANQNWNQLSIASSLNYHNGGYRAGTFHPSRSVPSLNIGDTRTHIVKELYDTEKSYVEQLQILTHKYLRPLKMPENAGIVDASIVDDIFFQIPEILVHHENFLEALKNRMDTWDNRQKVGDVIVNSFTKQPVIDTYTTFINNWKHAKESIKAAIAAKPAFAKFLESCSREHRGKLSLDALLIMPVQRIPRYELLIKELLKHTHIDHPDHRLLVGAQREVHELAVKINRIEHETEVAEYQQNRLREVENVIEGLTDNHLGAKKERCMFLCSDLLIITTVKRKSGTIRKSSQTLSLSSLGYMTLESNKYKLLMKISLADLDIVKSVPLTTDKVIADKDNLEQDMHTLGRISDLASSLSISHETLDELIRDMMEAVNKQMTDGKIANVNTDPMYTRLDLGVTTEDGIENISVLFWSAEKRLGWERDFLDAKEKLSKSPSSHSRIPPEFVKALPIRKTRAGLQFTCAAATLDLNAFNLRDVWVCNSDGYVGQVCVLCLQPEPEVTSCNGVCNARILCVASVPAVAQLDANLRRMAFKSQKPDIPVMREDGEDEVQRQSFLQMESHSDTSEDEADQRDSGGEGDSNKIHKIKDTNSSRESDKEDSTLTISQSNNPQQSTMWLGTEDGCIHIYNCNDNIRIKKNKVKLQHTAAIHCIIYLDNKVFISLANGNLCVYKRDSVGGWDTNDPLTVTLGSATSPITRMLAVQGKLWCGCQNSILVVNTSSLSVEHTFPVCNDVSRAVLCMVGSGYGVWISVQNSAVIKIFHAVTYECIFDVNVSAAVTKCLAGCDDIIRQHKAACLRITALLCCKDLLWIGTSAGVILNLTCPHINSTITRPILAPSVVGISHGHTGHVRFLSCVEMTAKRTMSVRAQQGKGRAARRRGSVSATNKVLIISGGDGFEDFQHVAQHDAAGRDDSTNHLLMWQV